MITLIYDFETSGLNPYHEDVTEIGCKCVETKDSFTCLVQPLSDKMLSDENQAITGITNKMLKKEGLKPIDAYIKFFNYLLEKFLVDTSITMIAHNGRVFDDIFLKRMHRYLQGEGHSEYDEMMSSIYFIDSLLLAKLLYPERRSHSMENMCKMFSITNKAAHRAMGDVNALLLVWNEMMIKVRSNKRDISGSHLTYLLYC